VLRSLLILKNQAFFLALSPQELVVQIALLIRLVENLIKLNLFLRTKIHFFALK